MQGQSVFFPKKNIKFNRIVSSTSHTYMLHMSNITAQPHSHSDTSSSINSLHCLPLVLQATVRMTTHISLRPAQPLDGPKIAALHLSAFSSNKLMRAIYPTPQIWAAFQSAVQKKITADIRHPYTTVMVAIARKSASEPGSERRTEKEAAQGEGGKGDEIIGFAVWIHPTPSNQEPTPPSWNLPEGTDWAVLRPWKDAAAKVASDVIGDRLHYGKLIYSHTPRNDATLFQTQ